MATNKLEELTFYQQLAERIRARILKGELLAGTQLEPIRTLAENEKLSIATVSKALDCLVDDGLLKKLPRKGIFVAGGRPDAAESAAQRVGILVPVFNASELHEWSLFGTALPKVQQRLLPEGKRISIHHCRVHPPNQWQWEYIPAEEIGGYGLDGMLAVGVYDFHYLAALARLHIPLVAFDVDASNLGLDSVFLDNVGAALELTRALLERGHRHVIYVGGPGPSPYCKVEGGYDPSAVERQAGYELGMRLFAPEQSVRAFRSPTREPQHSRQAFLDALAQAPECTAIVTEGLPDLPEIAARKIEVAGFRSIAHAGRPLPSPVVLYAEGDFPAMGVQAADVLLARMLDPLRPVQRVAVRPAIKAVRPDT